MLAQFKTISLKLLRGLGGFELIADSRWRRQRLLILCYHGFALRDEHRWNPGLYITDHQLERRLETLQVNGGTVLPLGEAVALLRDRALPPRAVAITVDDGLYDFFAVAYPILLRRRVPVTNYVSTYYVLDQRPVFNVMAWYLIWRAGENGKSTIRVAKPSFDLHSGSPDKVLASTVGLQGLATQEHWSADDKHDCLSALAKAAGEDWELLLQLRLFGLMTPAEIRSLDPGIADVQLHTHRHRAPLDRELFLREIHDNRHSLGRCGLEQSQRVHFCYPSGVHRPEFLAWLKEAAVATATTCVPGLANASTEPLLLPRFIDTGHTSDVEFEAWLCGIRQVLSLGTLRRARLGFIRTLD